VNDSTAWQLLFGLVGAAIGSWLYIAGLWLFCILAAALAAQSKRRSSVGWGFLGLAFGPLALLGLAAMDPPGRPCRNCDRLMSTDAKCCPWCGAEKFDSSAWKREPSVRVR
jgi:hypothetical protein